MKTLKQLLVISMVLSTFTLFAQKKVALHSNGVTTIFGGANPFTDAYNAASTGDTIYLPGGTLPCPAIINKGLIVFGAGHYPDSTTATLPTLLIGDLTISENADNLYLEGFELSGSITFTANHKVDFVKIKRCKFVALTYSGNYVTACISNEITECVITGNISLSNAESCLIGNCIIHANIYNGFNVAILNNIFFVSYPYDYIFDNVDNSFISNNIIFKENVNTIHHNCESDVFQNNVFSIVPPEGSNSFTGNYNSVAISPLFVNQSGTTFNYTHNYHLVNPTSYLGTDATQVGIYGGFHPYKGGSVPVNPHFQTKSIAPTTDNNGDLNIQIQVEAQDN